MAVNSLTRRLKGYFAPRPNSAADGSSHFRTGPRKPASAAAPRVFQSVSPARYSAIAADAAARNQVRDTCFRVSILTLSFFYTFSAHKRPPSVDICAFFPTTITFQ